MLHIHFSNRIERLADALATVLEEPAEGSALVPETLVIGHAGLDEWLKREIARRIGIAANLEFQQPGSFIWRMLRACKPQLPRHSPLERGALVWRLYAVLTDSGITQPPDIARYLAGGDERAPYDLAEALATVFEQYQIYRPDWMRDWEAGKATGDAAWQAGLWQRVAAGATPNPAQLFGDLVRHVNRLAPGNDLPARLSVFGITALAPVYLQLLSALAQTRDVYLFVPNPSRAYWGDIESEARLARWQLTRPERTEYATSGHPLLSALGTQTRDFIELLHDLPGESRSIEHYEYPSGDSLLARLQADMLDLVEQPETQAINPADESVQVHVCHSRQREVEVLHDTLLACFEADPALGPEDILVMAPNIDAYADSINAVFGAAPDERHIPYSLAERSVREEHPIPEAMLTLLDLPESRLRASEVISLLELPAIARHYGLDAQALGDLRRWVDAVGVRWGLDAAHRAELGLPEESGYTWRFGLDRLLAGYALAPDAEGLWDGIAPWSEFEGQTARPLGAVCAFVNQLALWRGHLAAPRSLQDWATALHELLAFFVPETSDELEALSTMRQAIDALAEQGERAEFTAEVPRTVARAALAARLAVPRHPRPFLSGRVTFCALAPMRSIPARVVWLLGMSEADFPRRGRPPGFDLIAEHPKCGDRARRTEDRALFLEALCATRQAFHVSYVGRSERDDIELPPSVVVAELLDVLGRMGAERDHIVLHHPLQPFSARYAAEPRRGASYAREWLSTPDEAIRLRAFAPDVPLEREVEPIVTLDELTRAFANPARTFQQALGIGGRADAMLLQDEEPFALDGLGRWNVRDALLARWLARGRDFDPRSCRSEFSAYGWLPLGESGWLAFEDAAAEAEALASAVRAVIGDGAPKSCDIDLTVGGWQVRGRIEGIYPDCGFMLARAGKLRAKDRLAIWIRHLALAVGGQATTSHFVGLDKGNTLHVQWRTIGQAAAELEKLCALYGRMQREPLPLLPDLSYEFSKTAAERGDEAAYSKVMSAWYSDWHNVDGDRDYAEVFRGRALFDASFGALAKTVFDPIRAAEES